MSETEKAIHFWMLALGGNLPSTAGTPVETLGAALKLLENKGVRVAAVSRFYETPCFPAGAGPDYVNAAALVESPLKAVELLAVLHEIEAAFGRERHSRWAGRTLDIDLLGGGDLVAPDLTTYEEWRDLGLDKQRVLAPEELILPHPRLQDRAFVLVPLSDVAPDWQHPVSGLKVSEMLSELPDSDRKAVVPL